MPTPIRVHPRNRKLFEFRGNPLVLVTATEHYGAVMNRPFNYARYLADAAEKRITLTRLFLLFRELQTPANPYSTCKPESPDYIAPYERTGPQRALDLQPVYDLDRPSAEFYERLHGFVGLASEHGVIVEVVFLSNTYGDSGWGLNPLNAHNNINGLEDIPWYEYMTRRHTKLYARQVDHVRRIVRELKAYDNIIYEICNEPGGGIGIEGAPTPAEVNEWLAALIRVVRETEAGLPNRHLIAGQEAFAYTLPDEESNASDVHQFADLSFADMDYDVVNMHPLSNMKHRGKQYNLGRFMHAELNLRAYRDYCLDTYREPKPLNLDEDNCASQYKGPEGWTIHRKRAWTALMCGAHYDVIDFSIWAYLETGTPDSQRHIRTWMKHLSEFTHSLDLASAVPMPDLVLGYPARTVVSAFGVRERDFAVYLADDREWDEPDCGSPLGGELPLQLETAHWLVSCYSPVTGLYSPAVQVEGGANARVSLPAFEHDLVLRFTRAGE